MIEQLVLLTLGQEKLGKNPATCKVQLMSVLSSLSERFFAMKHSTVMSLILHLVIIIPSSSRYDLHNVEREVKHQIIMLSLCGLVPDYKCVKYA